MVLVFTAPIAHLGGQTRDFRHPVPNSLIIPPPVRHKSCDKGLEAVKIQVSDGTILATNCQVPVQKRGAGNITPHNPL